MSIDAYEDEKTAKKLIVKAKEEAVVEGIKKDRGLDKPMKEEWRDSVEIQPISKREWRLSWIDDDGSKKYVIVENEEIEYLNEIINQNIKVKGKKSKNVLWSIIVEDKQLENKGDENYFKYFLRPALILEWLGVISYNNKNIIREK